MNWSNIEILIVACYNSVSYRFILSFFMSWLFFVNFLCNFQSIVSSTLI